MRGRPRENGGPIYVAGAGFGLEWQAADIPEFIAAYNELLALRIEWHAIIGDLAKLFKRPPVDVAILVLDLGERGYISGNGEATKKFKI